MAISEHIYIYFFFTIYMVWKILSNFVSMMLLVHPGRDVKVRESDRAMWRACMWWTLSSCRPAMQQPTMHTICI